MDGADMIKVGEASWAVEEGIKKAQKSVIRWSKRRCWLGDIGAEGVMHSHIAEELSKQGAGIVLVESAIDDLSYGVYQGDGVSGRRSKLLRQSGRMDIAIYQDLFDEEGEHAWSLYGMIEVKRLQTYQGWKSDIDRLCEAMKTYGQKSHDLEFAILGLYIQARNPEIFELERKKLNDLVVEKNKEMRQKDMRLEISTSSDEPTGIIAQVKEGNNVWCWGAFTVSILRKGVHFIRP
jgi:hypothetical protein